MKRLYINTWMNKTLYSISKVYGHNCINIFLRINKFVNVVFKNCANNKKKFVNCGNPKHYSALVTFSVDKLLKSYAYFHFGILILSRFRCGIISIHPPHLTLLYCVRFKAPWKGRYPPPAPFLFPPRTVSLSTPQWTGSTNQYTVIKEDFHES